MWRVDQLNMFLAAAEQSPYRGIYELTVLTGLRRSELAGLTWHCVDLANRTFRVSQTIERISGMGLAAGEPISEGSPRVIAVGDAAVQVLRRARV